MEKAGFEFVSRHAVRSTRLSAAADLTKDVNSEPVDGPINDWIDDAYRAKYHDSAYLSPMISARARSATVKVMPCGVDQRLVFSPHLAGEPI